MSLFSLKMQNKFQVSEEMNSASVATFRRGRNSSLPCDVKRRATLPGKIKVFWTTLLLLFLCGTCFGVEKPNLSNSRQKRLAELPQDKRGNPFETELHHRELTAALASAAGTSLLFLLCNRCHYRKRRRQEDEFRLERLIFDSLEIPVILYNPKGECVRMNKAARKLAESGEGNAQTLEHPGFEGESGREIHLNGRDYLVSARPIYSGDQYFGSLKTLLDITEQTESQRRLIHELFEARNTDKARNLFLATMSHELRTPLNAIIGFSELLRDNPVQADELNEYLQAINLAGNTLLKLINDILDLSKIDAQQMKIAPEPIEPATLAKEIQVLFHQKTDRQKFRYKVICPEGLPPLMLDELRIRQILLNLIGNAFKFTENGKVSVTFSFQKTGDEEGTFEIEVADTGVGITPEAADAIFDPFVQQDAGRDSRLQHGTGLGLAISRRLARCMGGDITLVSTVGKGSTFRLVLPKVQIAGMVNPPVAAPPQKESSGTRLRILLVDDVPLNVKVLAAMLKKLGAEVTAVSSGAEALEKLQKEEPDVLLTDLWMPEMNGEELATRIRENPSFASLTIVAVTADVESKNNFDLKNIDGVLIKPVTSKKLENLLAFLRSKRTGSAHAGDPLNFD